MLVHTKTKYVSLLIVLGGLVFFFKLGERDLWEPDETRYAVVAREMRETGQWILPRLNGGIYAEKPPLFFWAANLSVFFLGEDSELANRLPSAVAGFVTVFLTFLFGGRLFNSKVGLLSALVLGTCLFFPQLSRWMVLDSLVTLFFVLTLFSFYQGYEIGQRRRGYYLLAGLSMGLGVLTKGPVAWLPLPIFLIFAFLEKGLRRFWCVDLLFGFLLSLAIVLAWLIPAFLLGGEDYTGRIVLEQTLGRLLGNGRHVHAKPFFFYFVRFPIEFLPWMIFLPTAFIFLFSKSEAGRRKELLFLSVWFIFIFIFFSFSKGKKDNYILPLYPAAAIIVGRFWDSIILSGEREKAVISGILILTLLCLAVLALFVLGVPQKSYSPLMPYQSMIISISLYLFAGLSICVLLFVNGNRWASFLCIVAVFLLLHLHVSYALPSKLNAVWSMRQFSEKVLKRMEVGDELKLCFICPAGLLYYTRKVRLQEIRDKETFLEVFHSPRRVFVVITKRDLDKLARAFKMDFHIIEQERVYWDLGLVSNR